MQGGRQRAEDYAAGIWPWSCDNTVIQFNEVSGMKGTKDGQAFDSDYNCRNTLFQYNYSHDNDGGFMLVCSPRVRPGNIGCVDTVIRYNISQNDGARLFQISGPVSGHASITTCSLSRRTGTSTRFSSRIGRAWLDTAFANNIFYVEGTARFDFGYSTSNVFEHNVFYGTHDGCPDDPHAILADPKLVRPGSGGSGFRTLNGYKLQAESPCIGRGLTMPQPGDRDFWARHGQGARFPTSGPTPHVR